MSYFFSFVIISLKTFSFTCHPTFKLYQVLNNIYNIFFSLSTIPMVDIVPTLPVWSFQLTTVDLFQPEAAIPPLCNGICPKSVLNFPAQLFSDWSIQKLSLVQRKKNQNLQQEEEKNDTKVLIIHPQSLKNTILYYKQKKTHEKKHYSNSNNTMS